jgi:DNA-binding LytR/AlgR family response regulator
MYFESDANYTNVYFANGVKTTLLTSLTHLEELISSVFDNRRNFFIRIGKRFIVNSSFIFQINVLRQRLVLTDLVSPTVYTLSVSKEALKSLKALYITRPQD